MSESKRGAIWALHQAKSPKKIGHDRDAEQRAWIFRRLELQLLLKGQRAFGTRLKARALGISGGGSTGQICGVGKDLHGVDPGHCPKGRRL